MQAERKKHPMRIFLLCIILLFGFNCYSQQITARSKVVEYGTISTAIIDSVVNINTTINLSDEYVIIKSSEQVFTFHVTDIHWDDTEVHFVTRHKRKSIIEEFVYSKEFKVVELVFPKEDRFICFQNVDVDIVEEANLKKVFNVK